MEARFGGLKGLCGPEESDGGARVWFINIVYLRNARLRRLNTVLILIIFSFMRHTLTTQFVQCFAVTIYGFKQVVIQCFDESRHLHCYARGVVLKGTATLALNIISHTHLLPHTPLHL